MRLAELDALRGIAVLLVLGCHYTTRIHQLYPEIVPSFSMPWGDYGVDLFFIISGFVISLTLEKTAHWRNFVRSRFSRLFPAYWMANILTFAVVSTFGLPGRDISFGSFLVNFTMLQNWFSIPSTDGAYWSLFVELCFYLTMGILTFRFPSFRRSLPLLLSVWLLWILAGHFLTADQVRSGSKPLYNLLFLGFFGHLFVAGICFYEIFKRRQVTVHGILIPICYLYHILLRPPESRLIVAIAFLLFVVFVTKKLSWLARAPLLFLGEISYCLYLIHQNIGYVIIRSVHHLTGSWILGASTAVIAVTLTAALLTYFFEQPINRRLRRSSSGITPFAQNS